MKVLMLLLMFCLATNAAYAIDGVEVISYGDFASRDSNFTSSDYYSRYGGWSETRFVWGNRERVTTLRPYLKANLALSSRNVPEENTATYGPGVEIRPFAENSSLQQNYALEWITRTRVYAERLNQSFNKDSKPDWNPRNDTSFGFDIWRPYGSVDPDNRMPDKHRWAELFIGSAYHTTNFYIDDYDGIRTGINLKAGTKHGKQRMPFMPFIEIDLNTTSNHGYFWENRLIGGIGIRTELKSSDSSKINFYIEQLRVLDYLKDKPDSALGISRSDTRVGLSYQFNRY